MTGGDRGPGPPSWGTEDGGPDEDRGLYDQAPCGYLFTGPGGLITRVNRTFLNQTGYREEELVSQRAFWELLSPGGQVYYETHFAPLLAMQGAVNAVALDIARRDGSLLSALVSASLATGPGGSARSVRIIVMDGGDRRDYERELLHARKAAKESERRLRVLHHVTARSSAHPDPEQALERMAEIVRDALDAAGAGVWLSSEDGELVRASVAGVPTSLAPTRIDERTPRPLVESWRSARPVAVSSPAELDPDHRQLAEALIASKLEAVIAAPVHADATTLGAYTVYFARGRIFDDGELDLYRTVGWYIGQAVQRARVHAELRRRGDLDPLTGVVNRAVFHDRLDEALARSVRQNAPLTVMVIDLDDFKQVNDTLGHRVGDAVLVATADRVLEAVRPYDLVGRVGGDEFTLLCEGVDDPAARRLASRVRASLARPVSVGGETVIPRGSVGAVTFRPRAGEEPPGAEDLLHRADLAMYEEKDRRRRSGGPAPVDLTGASLPGPPA